ncbi:MAG: GAF domain-containing protein [Leptolyngbyaceae cyanobacterium CRU_2_3]|nr:GAF domain-containing protein [Leptolyngbyaceae cyanobacterium CRU_2_3]
MLIRKLRSPKRQAALLRRIVDRIRNSLELSVVLQTAVDEVASLLNLERCLFFWYFPDRSQIQVVYERLCESNSPSYLGAHSLSELGILDSSIQSGLVQSGLTQTGGGMINAGNPPHAQDDRTTHLLGGWQNRELHSNIFKLSSTRANLLMPVKGKDGSIGYIACLGNRPRHWSLSEVEFMQAIAQHLEIAICQAQLYEQTRKQAQQEQLINQITTLTRQSFNLNTILTEVIAQLFRALEVDRCLVHLVKDPDQDLALCETASDELVDFPICVWRQHLYEVCRPPFMPSVDTFDTAGPITAWVIQHRQQVSIDDITQDPRIGCNNPEYEVARIQSSLVIPVQTAARLHGILYLNQCSYTRHWSKDDRKLAQAVADQLAISIHQAHLYAQQQQQAIASAAQAQHLAETLEHLQQTQAQLVRSEKLSSLGQLVAGLAHEINNPISFIYGNIPYVEHYMEDLVGLMQYYQERFPQITEECQAQAQAVDLDFVMQDLPRTLHSLKTGAARIREIVQSLRSFIYLDQAQRRSIDLHEALEKALTLLHPQISPEIQIVQHYGEPITIEAYPKLLHQGIVNLLTNAIEALHPVNAAGYPKTLTLTTATFSDLKTAESWVKITIADTGCGIPLKVQSKIFDPFFTTKEVGQGTGLGLAITYHAIVNQHQGHLSFQSQPNQGSEFVVEIPVQPSNPQTRHQNSFAPEGIYLSLGKQAVSSQSGSTQTE